MIKKNKVEHYSEKGTDELDKAGGSDNSSDDNLFLKCQCLTCETLKKILKSNSNTVLKDTFLQKFVPLLETAGFLVEQTKNEAYCDLCYTVVDNKSKFKCPWLFHISKYCKMAEHASKILDLFEMKKEKKLSCSFYRYHTFQSKADLENLEKVYSMAEAGFFKDDKEIVKCFTCKNQPMSEDLWREHKNDEHSCIFADKNMPKKILYNIEYNKQFANYNYDDHYLNQLVSRRCCFYKNNKKRENYGSKLHGTINFQNDIYEKQSDNSKTATENCLNCSKNQAIDDIKNKETEVLEPSIFEANFLNFLFNEANDRESNDVKNNIKRFYKDTFKEKQQLYTTCVTIIETTEESNKDIIKQNEILTVFFEILRYFHQLFNDQYGGMILITNGIKTESTDPIKKIMTIKSKTRSEYTLWNSNTSSLYIRLLGVTNFDDLNLKEPQNREDNKKKQNKRILLDSTTKLNPFVTDFIFIQNNNSKEENLRKLDLSAYQDYSFDVFCRKPVSIALIIGDNFERCKILMERLSNTKNNSTKNDKLYNVIILHDKDIDTEKYQKLIKNFHTNITFICFKDESFRQNITKFLFETFCLGCKEQLIQLKLLDENQTETFKAIIKRTCSDKNLRNFYNKLKYLNYNNRFINLHFVRHEKLKDLIMHESIISTRANFTTLSEHFFQMMLFWAVLTDKHDAAEFFFESCGQKMAVASALVAAHLYKLKSKRSHICNTTLKSRHKEFSVKYIDKAITILNHRYLIKGENKSVRKMLKNKHKQLKNMDCMKIAGITKCGKFLDAEACRNVMDYKWHGKSAGSFIKFIIGSILMLVILLKQLVGELREYKKQAQEETKQKKKQTQAQNTKNTSNKEQHDRPNDKKEQKSEKNEANQPKKQNILTNEEKKQGKNQLELQTKSMQNIQEKGQKLEENNLTIKPTFDTKNANKHDERNMSINDVQCCARIEYYLDKFFNWIYQTYSDELIKPKYLKSLMEKSHEKNQRLLIKVKKTPININKFFRAPISKFSLNLINYTAFLVYYIIKVSAIKNNPWSSEEYLIFFWFLSFSIEELFEIFKADGLWLEKILGHIAISVFNIIDLIIIFFSVIIFCLRIFSFTEAAIYFYWLNGVLLIIRIFRELTAFRSLGPKLVMISIMLKKLLRFSIIAFILLTIFSFTFSIFSTSSLPFFKPYFVVGQLLYDYDSDFAQPLENCINGVKKNSSADSAFCAPEAVPLYITSICFIYLINVLLINFFIALFNDVYTKYSTKSNEIWRLSLYSLIEEYKNRPYLPPPLCIFEIINYVLNRLRQKCITKSLIYQRRKRICCVLEKTESNDRVRGENIQKKDNMVQKNSCSETDEQKCHNKSGNKLMTDECHENSDQTRIREDADEQDFDYESDDMTDKSQEASDHEDNSEDADEQDFGNESDSMTDEYQEESD